MLFQGAFTAYGAAITDIRRLGKLRTNILFIKDTGRGASATGPAKAVFVRGTFLTYLMSGALMMKSQETVIESSAIGAAFFEREVVFNFFGDGCAILVQ